MSRTTTKRQRVSTSSSSDESTAGSPDLECPVCGHSCKGQRGLASHLAKKKAGSCGYPAQRTACRFPPCTALVPQNKLQQHEKHYHGDASKAAQQQTTPSQTAAAAASARQHPRLNDDQTPRLAASGFGERQQQQQRQHCDSGDSMDMCDYGDAGADYDGDCEDEHDQTCERLAMGNGAGTDMLGAAAAGAFEQRSGTLRCRRRAGGAFSDMLSALNDESCDSSSRSSSDSSSSSTGRDRHLCCDSDTEREPVTDDDLCEALHGYQAAESVHSSTAAAAAAAAAAAEATAACNAAKLVQVLLELNISEKGANKLLKVLKHSSFTLESVPNSYRALRRASETFVAAQSQAHSSSNAAAMQERSATPQHFGLEGCITSSSITAYSRDVRSVLVERLQTLTSAQLAQGYERRTQDSAGNR
jgi:hypothetical protein